MTLALSHTLDPALIRDAALQRTLAPADRQRFLTAGHAICTLYNPRSGASFTYSVSVCDDKPDLFFVSVLTGCDNGSDYTYLGCLRTTGHILTYAHGRKSRLSMDAPSALAWAWFVGHLTDPRVRLYHEGRCGRCARRLTTVESLERGIGPECARVMGLE